VQFALEVVDLGCSFLKRSQGILGIKTKRRSNLLEETILPPLRLVRLPINNNIVIRQVQKCKMNLVVA
jgi:hypothetical protein